MSVNLLWIDPDTDRGVLEALSSDTLPADEVTGTRALLKDIGVWMIKMGDAWVPDPTITPGGTPHLREANALGATPVTMTWTATPLRSLTLFAVQEAAGTANLVANIAVCFEQADDTARDVLLTAGNSLTADSGRILVPVNTIYERKFSTPITKIGLKRNAGSEALSVIALGISVL